MVNEQTTNEKNIIFSACLFCVHRLDASQLKIYIEAYTSVPVCMRGGIAADLFM